MSRLGSCEWPGLSQHRAQAKIRYGEVTTLLRTLKHISSTQVHSGSFEATAPSAAAHLYGSEPTLSPRSLSIGIDGHERSHCYEYNLSSCA